MHRPRVGPILPIGSPSSSEISVYGTGGSAMSISSMRCQRPGQLGQRVADHLVALIREKPLVDLWFVRSRGGHDVVELGFVMSQDDPLTRSQAAQAFVAGRRRQPRADPFWVPDAVDVLKQP